MIGTKERTNLKMIKKARTKIIKENLVKGETNERENEENKIDESLNKNKWEKEQMKCIKYKT